MAENNASHRTRHTTAMHNPTHRHVASDEHHDAIALGGLAIDRRSLVLHRLEWKRLGRGEEVHEDSAGCSVEGVCIPSAWS